MGNDGLPDAGAIAEFVAGLRAYGATKAEIALIADTDLAGVADVDCFAHERLASLRNVPSVPRVSGALHRDEKRETSPSLAHRLEGLLWPERFPPGHNRHDPEHPFWAGGIWVQEEVSEADYQEDILGRVGALVAGELENQTTEGEGT